MLYDMIRTLLPSLPAKGFACSIESSADSVLCHRYQRWPINWHVQTAATWHHTSVPLQERSLKAAALSCDVKC